MLVLAGRRLRKRLTLNMLIITMQRDKFRKNNMVKAHAKTISRVYTHKLSQGCCLNNAWTTLLSCVSSIVGPIILFRIVSTILLGNDEVTRLFMAVGKSALIEQSCSLLLTCLFQLRLSCMTSMNKVELASMNNVELTSMNKVELASMNNVVNCCSRMKIMFLQYCSVIIAVINC